MQEHDLLRPIPHAIVALGGNIGDVRAHFRSARELLHNHPAITLLICSPIYRSAPLGPPQEDYLNAVVSLRSELSPLELLELLQWIEHRCGRVRQRRWGPRTLDLDLIDYAGLCMRTPALTLPHPEMHHRPFVLQPLIDVAPRWRHPVSGRNAHALLRECVAETARMMHDCW